MQITRTDHEADEKGDFRTIWEAVDAPYRMVQIEQPRFNRYVVVVERTGSKPGPFKVAFQTDHTPTSKLIINDLLLQLRRLDPRTTTEDIHNLLYAMGGAYGKNMKALKDFEDTVVYLKLNMDAANERFTRFPRILPLIEQLNSRWFKRPAQDGG